MINSLPPGNWALSIAHPGHELRLHGFLEIARPYTFILTDNSEAKKQDLMWDSIKVIDRATKQGMNINPAHLKNPEMRKALKISLMHGKEEKNHVKDSQIHFDVINRHIDFLKYYMDFMVENLTRFKITHFVCDPSEDYHLTHEVVRMVAELAVQQVWNTHEHEITLFDYPLNRPYTESITEECIRIKLTDEMLDRKLDAIVNFPLGIQDLKPNIGLDMEVINEMRKMKDGKEQIKDMLKTINYDFLVHEYLRPITPFEETDNYKKYIQPVYGKMLHTMMHTT